MSSPESSLEQLLAVAGLKPDDERFRWTVLTWDLTKHRPTGIDHCHRIFLTVDGVAGDVGDRDPKRFFSATPVLDELIGGIFDTEPPLHAAVSHSDGLIEFGGYRMVCQPLAVGCSPLEGSEYPDGSALSSPEHLISELRARSTAGIQVLHRINQVRGKAMDTHLAPGWEDSFPGPGARRRLWTGRPARTSAPAPRGGAL